MWSCLLVQPEHLKQRSIKVPFIKEVSSTNTEVSYIMINNLNICNYRTLHLPQTKTHKWLRYKTHLQPKQLSVLFRDTVNCWHYTASVEEKLIAGSTGGMIMTRENQSTQRKTCISLTLSTINPTWCGLGLNVDLHGSPFTTLTVHNKAHKHIWHYHGWWCLWS